jgi:protein SCO1
MRMKSVRQPEICRNPFGVGDFFAAFPPRVAPSSQPWAEGRNPFGIENLESGIFKQFLGGRGTVARSSVKNNSHCSHGGNCCGRDGRTPQSRHVRHSGILVKFTMALILFCAALGMAANAQSLTEDQLLKISFDQKLNSQVSLDLPFRDENGKAVTLRNYFREKPVVLVLGYYQCPMLCTLTFNGMVEAMNDMRWSIGKEFTVVHVSIDPKETAELAAAKKQSYLRKYGRAGAGAGWHFLTGDEPQIRKLADEVGFHYAYDPSIKQYAHPSGLVILTPDGKVAKYFFGVKFAPAELYASLQDASKSKVGSPIERLVLLCFHYSPIKGKYGALIMSLVRILGAATLVGIAWLFIAMIRRERARAVAKSPTGLPTPSDSLVETPRKP